MRRIRLRGVGRDKGYKRDSRLDRMADDEALLRSLRVMERNLSVIREAFSPALVCDATLPAQENAAALAALIKNESAEGRG